MTILLSDPRVSAVPVHENGEPLVHLESSFGSARALVTGAPSALYGPVDLASAA